MKNIYVLVKFELNAGIDISEWKGMSDEINKDIAGADGLIFRDSGVDEKGNVYCILKWETLEQQVTFRAMMDKKFEERPEMMKEFGRICNMDTMTHLLKTLSKVLLRNTYFIKRIRLQGDGCF